MLAHGVGGGRSDLPLPEWLFAYGAGFAVLISFVALGILWPKPRLAAASAGRRLVGAGAARPATWFLRAFGLLVYAVTFAACWLGPAEGVANFGVLTVYIPFWVGLQAISALLGDAYRALNPLDTLAVAVFGRRLPDRTGRADPGLWPAAAMVLSFVWLELAYHASDSSTAVGTWLAAYSIAALAGARWWGRRWVLEGAGFAALFRLVGHLGLLYRSDDGLRARWPVAGLATVRAERGLDALVLVTLGSTTFDGVSRLDWWVQDVAAGRNGWNLTLVSTVGLLVTIALVALVWLVATRLSARITGDDPFEVADAYIASLVPIVVGYAVAHYFSYAFYGTYDVIALASDPFGRGWDLFGTVEVAPDYRLLSPTLIAWVQTGAIALGHVAGVVVAHDRAVERHPALALATRSQWPLIAAMVAYTVAGLLLLLGA